jgi:hypothetical protein
MDALKNICSTQECTPTSSGVNSVFGNLLDNISNSNVTDILNKIVENNSCNTIIISHSDIVTDFTKLSRSATRAQSLI